MRRASLTALSCPPLRAYLLLCRRLIGDAVPHSDEHGPFAGTFTMDTPVKDAYCNRADGRLWSLYYAVTPDTGELYWVQFQYAPKNHGSGTVSWSVTDCSFNERTSLSPSETHISLRLDKEGAVSSAKEWYEKEGPYAGQYSIKLPVLGAYRNSGDGKKWSLKYKTQPDAGGEVFVTFEYKPLVQRNGGVKWTVVRMGHDDPSQKEVRASTAKGKSRKRASSSTSSKSKKAAGADGGGSSSSSSRKRRKSGSDGDGETSGRLWSLSG
jgi:hypothetical protein